MAFCIVAELMLGRGDKAWEIFCKANPVVRATEHEHYGVEPYIYSQFVAGPETNLNGQGFHHWLTSTCAWMQHAVVNWMLGARAEVDGLVIDPCIPKEWKEYEFTRPYRGKVLHIKVENPDSKNQVVKELYLNDRNVQGNLIKNIEKQENNIRAVLG
jgi:cellobiose phosphorylase